MGCNSSKGPPAWKGSVPTTPPGGRSPLAEQEAAQDENKEYRAVMGFLMQVPLFQRLPPDQHPILASACVAQTFQAGETIIRQGDAGNVFYIIRSGTAVVLLSSSPTAEPQEVSKLRDGDHFGEQSLLKNMPRAATVRATSSLNALTISQEKFKELKLDQNLSFDVARRKAVGAGGGGGGGGTAVKTATRKTAAETTLICSAIRCNENLQAVVSLDDARIAQMAKVAWMESVPQGKELIKQNDTAAEYFYIVSDGTFDVLVQEGGDKVDSASGMKRVSTVSRGGSFGELALLYSMPRAATVKATANAKVFVIDRGNFKRILVETEKSKGKLDEYVRYLHHVPLLKILSTEEKEALAKAMIEVHFRQGDVVLRQGEIGNTFYILYEGEVNVVKDGAELGKLAANVQKRKAEYFGERALLNNDVRAATVTVTSEYAKAMALDKEAFSLLLGDLEDIFTRRASAPVCFSCCLSGCSGVFAKKRASSDARQLAAAKVLSNAATESMALPNGRDRIRRKDLKRVGLLGCGGFGTVELWVHKDTGMSYAMKSLSKGHVIKTNMQESVMTERHILMMTNSRFIITLYETYNGAQTLYFLMEPALGGELHAIYRRRSMYGQEDAAKYYSGGVVFAFEHLHERRVIYRDLKPENLLLTEKGHIKLADMGLSKFVIGKTYTTCGTPDYFAPEVLASTGHTDAVDWWMLGILIFELLTGNPPFEAESHMKIFSNVMKGIEKVKFPPNVTGPSGDLIRAILQKEPAERLPVRPGGTKNLKDHAWFNGFSWDDLWTLDMTPPYAPSVKSKTDIQNFTACLADLPPQIPYKDDGSGWDADFASSE